MPADFHSDMDKYLGAKRRKKLFSDFKSKLMNKKALVSHKASTRFEGFRGKLSSKVEQIKNIRKEHEKEITQEQIDEVVEKRGIKREPKEVMKQVEKTAPIKEEQEEGWKEVKLEGLEGKKEDLSSLEQEKKKVIEELAKIEEKEKLEKEKIAKLSDENIHREKAESEGDKVKRLELEEDVKILKEKQKIEEDRLAELKKARRIEQMEALRGRVTDILFKKKPKKEKDMVEEVRKEVRRDAKVEEAERQRVEAKELGRPKEDVTKAEENQEEQKEEVKKVQDKGEIKEPTESKEEEKVKKSVRSFFSNFIQIKTAAQIAKEEEEMLKVEEEEALRHQSEVKALFGETKEEFKTNIPAKGEDVNLSTLFQDEGVQQEQNSQEDNLFPGEDIHQERDDTIELDQGYKIKIVRN